MLAHRMIVTAVASLAALAPGARAAKPPFLPPAGRVWSGVTGGLGASDINAFTRGQGAKPPVVQFFSTWGKTTAVGFLDGLSAVAARAGARPAFALSMTDSSGKEAITPKALATGSGDAALLGWNTVLADARRPVYVRPFYQMNNAATVQCAFNADGTARDAAHSIRWFIAAWRRTVLIMRGGPMTTINARLHALGLPAVQNASGVLPAPQVAFLWVPSYTPVPAIAANSWNAYYPGDGYVDWVGTQAKSNYIANSRLSSFYNDLESKHHRKPFTVDEWGILGTGDDPSYASGLLSWARSHAQVRMLIYNQGFAGSPTRLQALPGVQGALRAALRHRPFS